MVIGAYQSTHIRIAHDQPTAATILHCTPVGPCDPSQVPAIACYLDVNKMYVCHLSVIPQGAEQPEIAVSFDRQVSDRMTVPIQRAGKG